KDFNDFNKEELTRILSASTQDSESWTAGSKIWLQPSSTSAQPANIASLVTAQVQPNGNSGTSPPSAIPSKTTTRPAVIESESFLLPASAVLCLHGLSSFFCLNT